MCTRSFVATSCQLVSFAADKLVACRYGKAAVLLVIVSLLGCNGPAKDGPSTADAAVKKVKVTLPEIRSVARVIEQPGTIQAYEETQLFARVPGYVSKIHVDIGKKIVGPKFDSAGKEVEPGEVLVEIAVPELEEETNQKRSLTKQAEAEVEQTRKAQAAAEANIATMEAAVIETKALHERWDSESKRIATLVKSGVIDAQTRDEAQHQFKAAGGRLASAEAAVRKAKADFDKAGADVGAAVVRVEVAKAETRRLEALLGFAKIRAPYDGKVVARAVNTGDFVQPAGRQGAALFSVAKLDPVRVVIDVPEADAALVEENKSEARLTIKPLRIASLTKTITRTSWALKPGSRTLRAEIDLPNKDGHLRPGMYVYAHIQGQWPKGWTLPVGALVKQGDAMVCFRVEAGKAVKTPVLIGRGDGQFTEVLKLQKPGTPPTWEEFTGKEEIAAQAAGLTDGQTVQRETPSK